MWPGRSGQSIFGLISLDNTFIYLHHQSLSLISLKLLRFCTNTFICHISLISLTKLDSLFTLGSAFHRVTHCDCIAVSEFQSTSVVTRCPTPLIVVSFVQWQAHIITTKAIIHIFHCDALLLSTEIDALSSATSFAAECLLDVCVPFDNCYLCDHRVLFALPLYRYMMKPIFKVTTANYRFFAWLLTLPVTPNHHLLLNAAYH